MRLGAARGWRKDARLHARCPRWAEYLWEWFQELSNERSYLPSGLPAPLTSQQILAWCALRGVVLLQKELDVLKLLDVQLINVHQNSKAWAR